MSAYSDAVAADTPVAWFRGNGVGPTLYNTVNPGADASIIGGGGATLDQPGLIAADPQLSVEVPGSVYQTTAAAAPMTAAWSGEGWFRFTTFGVLFAHDDDGPNIRWRVYANPDGSLAAVYRRAAGGYVAQTTTPGVLALGSTYHVVNTYDGATARLYFNGVEVSSLALGAIYSHPTNPGYRIAGIFGTSASGTMVGRFQDVAIYGTALSPARVLAHYTAATSVPAPAPPTGLAQVAGSTTAVTVAWTASSGATSYDVRVDGGPSANVSALEREFTGLDPDTDYLVEVRAVGPGGVSAWVSVTAATTPDVPPTEATYRATVRLGPRTWDVSAGDPPALGPILPVSFGWEVPEDSLGFPAQPDPDLANLELVTADYADMVGVDIGSVMLVSLYVTGGTRPLATFRGRVADMEAAPHPMGLYWRVLGVGYTADPGSRQVGTSAWPQESGDDRAARIMAEAGFPGWTAPPIGTTFEAREPAAIMAREVMEAVADEAVTAEGTPYGPARRVLFHPVTTDNGDLTPTSPFAGAAVLRRTDALDAVSAGLVNRATSWRRTKLLDATWVRIDHPGGPSTFGDTRGPAYPPQSVSVTDPRELADLILDTTPGYRWLTGQPLRLELWADDGPAQETVAHWFYRDPDSPPFPWSGRAVLVSPIDKSPDGSATYAGMLTAATIRLEPTPGAGGRLVVEFRLRPDIPADSTVTMRWMDEPAGATWADELADDPTGTWYDYYTRPRP